MINIEFDKTWKHIASLQVEPFDTEKKPLKTVAAHVFYNKKEWLESLESFKRFSHLSMISLIVMKNLYLIL